MHWPYTVDFAESFFLAQACAALLLTALLLSWSRGSRAARAAMLFGVWLAVAASSISPVLASFGYRPEHDTFRHALAVAALLGTVAALLSVQPVVAVLALLGEIPLWLVSGFVKDSDGELASLHLAWLGLLLGLLVRASATRADDPREPEDGRPVPSAEGSYALHDSVLFVVGTVLAALVAVYVMRQRMGSADEWGYTFQASVFAKGRLYSGMPRCQPYLENFYVYESAGRMFAQYTPGWPLFLTPFVWLRAVWLAAPVSMGLMAVGMARLARSAMRADGDASAVAVRAAGTWGALLPTLGTTLLINAASRYPHVFVLALYAWTLEAIFVLSKPGLSPARQWRWGLLLGSALVLNAATRPADGAFVGGAAAVWGLYLLARQRVELRAVGATVLAAAFWSVLVLVVLRLQIGRWFTTGYALNEVVHPWNVVKYSQPTPSQWKYGLPLATGAYCWWPCCIALGLAGLALLRGRALGLLFAFVLGCVPYVVYTEYLDLGQRGYDWGYGPRYLMVLVVPLSIGCAVVLGRMTAAARARLVALPGPTALARGGPLALALFAFAFGWIRLVVLVWPTDVEHTRRHAGLATTIEAMQLKNAIVLAQKGTTGFSDEDLTTNLPIDLYPDQDVIIAIDRATPKEAAECLRTAYPERTLYYATGIDPVRIEISKF